MGRPKAKYETKSINRGFRMKPSTIDKLKKIACFTEKAQNVTMEYLIEREYENIFGKGKITNITEWRDENVFRAK